MEVSGVPLQQKKWFQLSQFFFCFNEINLFDKKIP